ncbi:MAG: glucose-6-phosphate dehydrogenase [Bacteroidales bacterium]|nr:glucose-6-phosphate dehydrogenase [Bacteroidales bacterium]
MEKPEPHILVIFGASGDLTERKLIPALFDLYLQGLIPKNFAVLGIGRTNTYTRPVSLEDESRSQKFSLSTNEKDVETFIALLHYTSINTYETEDYAKLRDELILLDNASKTKGNIIYYLATPPSVYEIIPANLAAYNLNGQIELPGWKRIIIEKPFGTGLSSAKQLNQMLLQYFNENQLYRIDHYLGKETVQNLLVTRFANGIYEPLWNRNYIHHIEITSAESIGVENRGGYYDHSGALRDMVQNHLLQVAALIAMEPPSVIDATSIRNETVKVLQSLRPLTEEDVLKNVIRGQYGASHIKGESIKAYRQETGVPEKSRTETYVAMKFFIDNWRWGGVPFYIRTGKRLPTRVTEAVIHFKKTPHALFRHPTEQLNQHNQLVLRIQPDEGILLKFATKIPGAGFDIQNVNMDFHYSDLQDPHLPSAYERLLLDCMQGDATLYARGDAVEQAWGFVEPVLDGWANNCDIPLYGYPAGTWGPENADSLIDGDLIMWRYPCKNLAKDGEYCEL